MVLFRNVVWLESYLGRKGLLSRGKKCVQFAPQAKYLLSTVPGDRIIRSPVNVEIPDIGFWEFMETTLQQYGSRCALECGKTKRKITYERLLHEAKLLSLGMPEIGVKKGNTVATFLFNSVNVPVITLGLARAGIIMAPINVNLKSSELSYLLNASEATTVITETKVLPVVEDAIKRSPNVSNIVLTDGQNQIPLKTIMSLGKSDLPIHIDPKEDVIFRNFSSGTTGAPKVVELTHRCVVAALLQIEKHHRHIKKKNSDSWHHLNFIPLAFYHIAGMAVGLLESMYRGDHIVSLPAFKSEDVIQVFKDYKFDSMGLVPPMIQFLVACQDITREQLDTVYWVWYGSAPTGITTLEKFQQKTKQDIIFNEVYGLTECLLCHSSKNVRGFIGTILPSSEAKVVDINTGEALAPNQEGEICIKSPSIMKGYLNNPKATNEMIRDGWCYTGDIGWYDERQEFFITGRSKELIKVKGNQVAPAELENLLREHTDIADVAVVGVPDEKAGELPRAFIVRKKGATLSGKEVEDFLHPKIATFKQLGGGVRFIDLIPKNPSGKILRRLLKEY